MVDIRRMFFNRKLIYIPEVLSNYLYSRSAYKNEFLFLFFWGRVRVLKYNDNLHFALTKRRK